MLDLKMTKISFCLVGASFFFIACAVLMFTFSSCTRGKQPLFALQSSEDTGITFNNRIVETDSFNILTEEYIFNGGGVAVGDFDNDGKPDLFFSGNQVANKLYLNQGDFKFKDVSEEAGIEARDRWNTGIAIVDINNDNWLDIYVCSAILPAMEQRANMLFVNQGLNENGLPHFKEMAGKYGIDNRQNSMAATFFDYDNDGYLDLYVLNNEQNGILPTNYRKRIKDGSALSNDRLYHNNGNGTFTDVTMEAGILIEGFGLGLAVADFNHDGWPDLYVSNDYLTNDLLYINKKDGTFENEIAERVRHQSKFSMGSDVADFNNDGYLDIVTLDMLGDSNYRMKTTISDHNYIFYVLNERWGYEYQYTRNMLQLGNGPDIPFSEVGLMAGMYKTDWSWSPLFVDADNDGYKDLLITNGFPRDITDKDFADFRLEAGPFTSPGEILDSIPVVKIPNYGFRNKGDWTFEDTSKSWGLDIPSFSNGAAYADLDEDGDMDYVVNNINDEAFVFENTLQGHTASHYLKISLKGPQTNIKGIGAKIVVRYGEGQFQYYEHYVNRGYISSMEHSAHFGLGKYGKVGAVEILWPDGMYQKVPNVKTDQNLVLDYKKAGAVQTAGLEFPFIIESRDPVFREIAKETGIRYLHREQDIIDYNLQRTLPHKLSQNGPCVMAGGDIDGNGTEDLIVGSSAGYSPVIFFQERTGSFVGNPLFRDEPDMVFEEEGMALFDLENDGDLDLYFVSGSNEFMNTGELHKDRLLLNDGKGNFTISEAEDLLPVASGSVVKAYDFDQDGYTDLFVGGRAPMGSYPKPDKSFLLRNDKGKLVDVTDEIAPGLSEVGMIEDAVWKDVDKDGLADLVVVGEYMPVSVFRNTGTDFKKMESTGIEGYLGWWKSIIGEDFDGDGDVDFVVGNMGANNFYKPSFETPVTMLAKDFDANGSLDPLLFAYFKNNEGKYESFPVNFWGDLIKQSPLFRGKFNLFREYGLTTEQTIFNEAEMEGALKFIGNYDRSSYVENLGNGKFRMTPLPKEAQMAPINDMEVLDYNKDGYPDILLVGNDYGNEIFIGRYDAFNGLLLEGDGRGNFIPIASSESGFVVPGDAKSICSVKRITGEIIYAVAQNRDSVLVLAP